MEFKECCYNISIAVASGHVQDRAPILSNLATNNILKLVLATELVLCWDANLVHVAASLHESGCNSGVMSLNSLRRACSMPSRYITAC